MMDMNENAIPVCDGTEPGVQDLKSVLVVLFANNNHLSNVKTLQSIYRQNYGNFYLLVCNDAGSNFQAERLLYNFLDKQPEGIQQIYMVENRFPKGEICTLRDKLGFAQTDYVLILHAGEYLAEKDTLSQCVEMFEAHENASALALAADLYYSDMKELDETYTVPQDGQIDPDHMRDCMLFYRYDTLAAALQRDAAEGCTTLWEHALPDLSGLYAVNQSVCHFSKTSIEDTPCEIPQELGNPRMLKIARMLAEGTGAASESAPASQVKLAAPRKVSKKQKLVGWLYKQSRFHSLLIYAILALLLVACAVLFLWVVPGIGKVLGVLLAVAAVLAVLWCFGLVAFNLYFRKHPERLMIDNG